VSAPAGSPKPPLRSGDPFNPYKRFTGIFIPEAVYQDSCLSIGAKLIYGRLCRYAGEDGDAYPSVPTLGSELLISPKQARRYVRELENQGFIRVDRVAGRSSHYTFLWRDEFDPTPPTSGSTTPPRNGSTTPPTSGSQRESVERESVKRNRDFDCANRKNGDSRECMPPSTPKPNPKLREALTRYMRAEPTDRQVLDVLEAAAGATEAEVVDCLVFLYDQRKLRPGTDNGPRSFAWFPTVVQDYFDKRQQRTDAANPSGFAEWEARLGK